MPATKPSLYRPDIDVLRALAVVLVMLFHGQIPFFPGGFIGVDIFFVISGFLITNIITKQLQADSFSYVAFFTSRFRRIGPALIVMVLIIWAFCYFFSLYSARDFTPFRHSARSALFFYSNIFFHLNTGYFDAPAVSQVFLHTWSLGVEAQFYFIYPFLLCFAFKRWPAELPRILLWAVVVLFILSSFFTHFYPSAGFYLFPTRAWELFAGGWLALSRTTPTSQKAKELFIVVGVIIICLSAIIFNNLFTVYTPGAWAFFPIFGAALVISGGTGFTREGVVRSFLHNKKLIHLGLISYSLYLWHWPFFVIYRLFSFTHTIPLSALSLLVIAIIVVAHFSWKYIEQPTRLKLSLWPIKRQILAFSLCLALAYIPTKLITFPHYAFANKAYLAGADDQCQWSSEKAFGDTTKDLSFMIIGDSHAQAMACAFNELAKETQIKGQIFITEGFINGARARVDIEKLSHQTKELINQQKPPVVFLISRWTLGIKGLNPNESSSTGMDQVGFIYRNGKTRFSGAEAIEASLRDTIAYLVEHGTQHIFILLPTPESHVGVPRAAGTTSLSFSEDMINAKFGVPRTQYDERNKETLDILASLEADFPQVQLVDIRPIFYPQDAATSLIVKDGKSLYYDDDHLSRAGARLLIPLLSTLPMFNNRHDN